MTLDEALALVRDGKLADAEVALADLRGFERLRLDMALAYKRGDAARSRELAAALWHAYVVDPTVLSVLVQLDHPELREPAGELLMRLASDAAYDVAPAWQRLAEQPGDLDAWRDIIAHLLATGRELDAVDGVAHALSERVADFTLWAQLATQMLAYRRRAGLVATIALGTRAFPHAFEMHATACMAFLALGDLASAERELAAVGERGATHPLVVSARSAMAQTAG
jgi:hypothetical protein